MGELALHFEMVASFYMYMVQPNHSYSYFMFSLHSDPTRVIVVAGVLVSTCLVRTTPPREYHSQAYNYDHTVFNHVLVQRLSGIYYVL